MALVRYSSTADMKTGPLNATRFTALRETNLMPIFATGNISRPVVLARFFMLNLKLIKSILIHQGEAPGDEDVSRPVREQAYDPPLV